jgi:hypothetical protein
VYDVGVADSYARRSADSVYVRLHLPARAPEGGQERVEVQLVSLGKGPKRRVDVEAEVSAAKGGSVLEVRLPRGDVEPGRWQVRVRDGAGPDFRRARARLLVRPRQPVALLVGPAPATQMPPPKPRGRGTGVPGRAAAARRRLRRLAGAARRRVSALR